jgi:hypothetical protein
MTYVTLYKALRLIVRLLPDGGEPLAANMTDEWIRRGVVAFEPDKSVLVVYRDAIKLLKQAIHSDDVDVMVGQRQIAKHERSFDLEIERERLAAPYGFAQPPVCDLMIRKEDLERLMAPKQATEPETVAMAPTKPKPTKRLARDEFLAEKLVTMYGPVRPGLSVEEMRRAILARKDPTIGRFSDSTFKRARKIAWPTPASRRQPEDGLAEVGASVDGA